MQDLACTVLITHIQVGPCQVQLGGITVALRCDNQVFVQHVLVQFTVGKVRRQIEIFSYSLGAACLFDFQTAEICLQGRIGLGQEIYRANLQSRCFLCLFLSNFFFAFFSFFF